MRFSVTPRRPGSVGHWPTRRLSRSPAEIAALLGVRPHEAGAATTAARGIADRILTGRYGITAPTAWDSAALSA